jgi:transcription termination factor Rho
MTKDTLSESAADEAAFPAAPETNAPAKKRATKKAAKKTAAPEGEDEAVAAAPKRRSKKMTLADVAAELTANAAAANAPVAEAAPVVEEVSPAPKAKRATKKKAAVTDEAPSVEATITEAAPAEAPPVVIAPEPVIEAATEAPSAPSVVEASASVSETEPAEASPAPSPAPSSEGPIAEDPAQGQRKLRWWEKRKLERKARQAARAAGGGAPPPSGEGAPAPQHKPQHPHQHPRHAAKSDFTNDDADFEPSKPVELGPPEPTEGLLDIGPKGHGFLRLKDKGWAALPTDSFVHGDIIRKNGLRQGMFLTGEQRKGPRGFQLTEVFTINGRKPEELRDLPIFEELKAINPNKRYQLETRPDRYTTRVVDMLTPVGRGQRGLIVSPPRAGKTTMLRHIAEAVAQNFPQVHLMVLLVDERPEEVTDFKRTLTTAEVFASSNDQDNKNHSRIAELAIERAKRLVEMGDHVFMLMDSITRLARCYNNMGKGGATGSGGMAVGAMEIPRRLFAAARNTRGAGSLTILATALIETGSRMDDVIFQEFKGTGNMELVLDRKIAEQFIWPAVNIFKSGTRREELLLQSFQLEKIHFLRRGLAGHKPIEAIQRVLSLMERQPNNAQMLVELSSKEK